MSTISEKNKFLFRIQYTYLLYCFQNIEKFINEATQGVIYFSMGSLLRSETFPKRKLNAFLYAFSKIPQRILWKWGSDTLPGKSDNIMISKWMPQRDIFGRIHTDDKISLIKVMYAPQ